MNQIIFSRKDTGVQVTFNGRSAGIIRALILRPGNDNINIPLPCEVARADSSSDGVRLEFVQSDEDAVVVLDLKKQDDGFTGAFSATGKGRAIVKLVWELPAGEGGFPFIPAFMYGHNEGGRSPYATYPQLDTGSEYQFTKPWVSGEWLVRTDRSSHGFTSVIAGSAAYAIGGRDVCRRSDGTISEKTGLGIDAGDPHRLTFSLGFANIPYTYSVAAGRNFISRPEGFVDLDKGEVSAELFLFAFEHDSRHAAAARLLRESYAVQHDSVNDAGTVRDGVVAVSEAIVDYCYCPEARNFHTTVHAEGHVRRRYSSRFDTAWTGGLRVAWPLLAAGHRMNEERWLRCARDVFSNVAKNGISEKSGLFNETFDLASGEWSAKGWWYGALEKPGHSGYINGQACHCLLLGYRAEKEAGVDQPAWLAAARRVLDHLADVQGGDGRFGYTFSEKDGSILDGDGFSGCWFAPAFGNLYRITGEARCLEVARRAMDFYRGFVESFHCYGGPHDIFKSPDEEGILAWIESARILHEITGEEQYLQDLLMGLDYEFSWKFAYNVVNEVEPLKSMNWCSTGGSVTSVNNSHIHPMGGQIANSLLYASELTGDPYLRSRFDDTVRWSLNAYLHHDGQYGWGKKGQINERFCYTDSLLLERFADGSPASTWFCGHSWASGAVLEGLVGVPLHAFA